MCFMQKTTTTGWSYEQEWQQRSHTVTQMELSGYKFIPYYFISITDICVYTVCRFIHMTVHWQLSKWWLTHYPLKMFPVTALGVIYFYHNFIVRISDMNPAVSPDITVPFVTHDLHSNPRPSSSSCQHTVLQHWQVTHSRHRSVNVCTFYNSKICPHAAILTG